MVHLAFESTKIIILKKWEEINFFLKEILFFREIKNRRMVRAAPGRTYGGGCLRAPAA
jgi:hypothetical protein